MFGEVKSCFEVFQQTEASPKTPPTGSLQICTWGLEVENVDRRRRNDCREANHEVSCHSCTKVQTSTYNCVGMMSAHSEARASSARIDVRAAARLIFDAYERIPGIDLLADPRER